MSQQWSGQSPFANYQIPTTPPPKPRAWRRRWVQMTSACVLSFAVGASIGGGGSATAEGDVSQGQVQRLVDDKLADARSTYDDKLSDQQASSDAALNRAEDEAASDLKAAQKHARSAQKAAVSRAVAATRKKMQAKVNAAESVQPRPVVSQPAASTDPRFAWCYEANDAGYGPYRRGVDPEYDWYRDNDSDGVVCEQ